MFKSLFNWLFGAKPEQPAEAPYKVEAHVQPVAAADIPVIIPAEAVAVTTTVLEVKAKFKKADLEKMTKAELVALAQERGLEIKARTVKAELIKALMKS